jgi:glycosyltransferase involved in cell wall biosynthesis
VRIAVVTDLFPVASETFVTNEIRELESLGHHVVVEATRPPRASRLDRGCELKASYLELDPLRAKPAALAELLARHPVSVAMDLTGRRRWGASEDVRPLRALALRARRLRQAQVEHMHVHFAAGAALDSMRLAAILGLPYSVTAHAYDIFASPTNLEEKLSRAAFVTSGCDYNVRYLQGVVGSEGAPRIHKIVMGVDLGAFKRERPYPGGRHVVAVGRLVEKKGFSLLVEAAAKLRDKGAVERLTIVGGGPLEEELRAQVDALDLAGIVELVGARTAAEVRAYLESADVLAMPCVVAADGDRDSMPVVVKEALAMEVPVVGTDEVGLPELVRPEFGRLVAPGDADALAQALREVLALPASERAEMGREGRRWVAANCSVRDETQRLVELIVSAVGPGAQRIRRL